jgi:hypothetical protein
MMEVLVIVRCEISVRSCDDLMRDQVKALVDVMEFLSSKLKVNGRAD